MLKKFCLPISPFLKKLLPLLLVLAGTPDVSNATPLIVDKYGKTVYQFPGNSGSQQVPVTFPDVGYQKLVRSNQCGIITVTFPKKFKYSDPVQITTRFIGTTNNVLKTTGESTDPEPVCTGSAYNGTKWTSGSDQYYFWRKGSTAKYWRSNFQPYSDQIAHIFTLSIYYSLNKSYKADSCGVVSVSVPYINYDIPRSNVQRAPTGYILYDGDWSVGNETVDTNLLWGNVRLDNGYICKKGVLYSPR